MAEQVAKKRPNWQFPPDVALQNRSVYRGDKAKWTPSPNGVECNRCGGCCEVVHPSTDIPDLHALAANPYIVGSLRRQAELVLGMLDEVVAFDHGRKGYTCKHFDPVTRLCTDHANRPDMCRGYPWYDRTPHKDAYMPAQCSFQADLRKQLPIVAITGGKVPVPAS